MPAPIQQAMLMLGSGALSCSSATAFLARTSGLDTTHRNAYSNLLCGLDLDGVLSKLDALYIFATQDSATALLNLVSTNYTCVSNGPPTFVADRGFTGVSGSSSVYLDTQFNPITATTPNYVLGSAHISAWSNTSAQGANDVSMGLVNGGGNEVFIIPRTTSNIGRFAVNCGESDVSNTDGSGYYIAVQPDGISTVVYRNGVQIISAASTGSFSLNMSMPILAIRDSGTGIQSGSGRQHSAASIGASLSSTDAGNLNSRVHTYMTAVGNV